MIHNLIPILQFGKLFYQNNNNKDNNNNMSASRFLRVLKVQTATTSYPTGNKAFPVMEGLHDAVESDPFLVCDFYGPFISKGKSTDPDRFDVPWHPHRGADITTYLKEGVGRHADSLGNREEFASPGMQWISVGSGIEHAEGGGTPAGQGMTGFQIWINVPAVNKMDDPAYGTVGPQEFPMINFAGGKARILAGQVGENKGPFRTKQELQMIDFELEAGGSYTHSVPLALETCFLYVYGGSGQINDRSVTKYNVIFLDAANRNPDNRDVHITAGSDGLLVMLLTGKRINEPIVQQGPFVMNTQEEIYQAFSELRSGRFPPKRTPWDYKRWSEFPKEIRDKLSK